MARFLAVLLLLVAAALGAEDVNYDPELNYRPENVTDLAYYLYAWRGSYYNGTAKFTLEPWDEGDDDDDEACSRYNRSTITFAFDTLMAIVEPNEDDDGDNPFMLLIRSWPDDIDLWPTGGNTNPSPEQINSDVFAIDSVTPRQRTLTDSGSYAPLWNVSARHTSGSAYQFDATSNAADESFQVNMTHCDGTPDVWWGGGLLNAESGERWVDASRASDPSISGRFDDRTASFELEGVFFLNTDSGAPEDVEELSGRLIIEFEGEIDEDRSDRLVGGDDVPEWEATVGFEGGEGGDDSGAVGRKTMASCGYAVLTMALLAVFY